MNKNMALRALLACVLLTGSLLAHAFETIRVTENVYALVGDLGQRSPANLGHNITSGFIITDAGVVVIDTGGSLADAQAIHAAIRKVTTKPVIYAVNTGGQDHRWFGNDYFKRQGASIVAAEAAVRDMRERGAGQAEASQSLLMEKFDGTRLAYPDITFAQRHTLPVKGEKIELIYTGGAHTIGDIFVWLPQRSIVFPAIPCSSIACSVSCRAARSAGCGVSSSCATSSNRVSSCPATGASPISARPCATATTTWYFYAGR